MAPQVQEDAQKSAYRRWYEKNKEQFNAKRRQRYQEDDEYREKALENTRTYRSEGVRHPELADTPMYREWNGELIEVFRISTVAEMIGRSVQAIRKWEKNEIIPKPYFGRGHRVYTANQIKLLKKVAAFSDKYRYNRAKYYAKLEKLVNEVYEKW